MRPFEDIADNSQVQITENLGTHGGEAYGLMGYLNLRECKRALSFMLTVEKHGNKRWEHVSVSFYGDNRKTPSWADMCAIKDIFWHAEEEVHQIHPKASQYVHGVGRKENILHLWRPAGGWVEEEE